MLLLLILFPDVVALCSCSSVIADNFVCGDVAAQDDVVLHFSTRCCCLMLLLLGNCCPFFW